MNVIRYTRKHKTIILFKWLWLLTVIKTIYRYNIMIGIRIGFNKKISSKWYRKISKKKKKTNYIVKV